MEAFNEKGKKTYLYISWVSLKTFWKRFYKETKRKRKISEKKRISQERFFPEKILFSKKKISFHKFFSKYSWRRVIKHENGSIGCVRTIRIVQKSRKSIRSGQKVKKRIFSGKKSLLKKFSFSLRFFSFSRDFFSFSLNFYLFHIFLSKSTEMKSTYFFCKILSSAKAN